MKKHPPPISIVRARQLRRDVTDAERVMWRSLKEHFERARFRRQVPIRHYIADFVSHRHRMVIEIDGGQHDSIRDARRTAEIEAEGYRVLRFWNNEVIGNLEGCLLKLRYHLAPDHPQPTATSEQARKSSYPSPIKGEEGKK